MCRKGQTTPCGDPSHHAGDTGDPWALTGPRRRAANARAGGLPRRLLPDAGPGAAAGVRRAARVAGRRSVLGGLLTAATAAACVPGTIGSAAPIKQEAPSSEAPPPAAPTALPTAVPQPTVAPTPVPPPEPQLTRLGLTGIVQPQWTADAGRILYYDQPAPGQGGTWSIDPNTAATTRDRPQWGYYAGGTTLVATPRTAERDTYVRHLASGREWALPTTNSTVFSADGTMVAYTTAAIGQPGGPPPGPGLGFSGTAAAFVPTTIVVSWADGQNAQRMQLPINGSVVSWLPAPDGTPKARLLLSGRRAEKDDPSIWAFDLRDRSLVELGRSKRLVGILPSPDGKWVAHVSMWNANRDEDGLWLTRTDGGARRRVELTGGYRWTGANRLVMIPVRAFAADSHEVWQLDPETGEAYRLTNPATHAFRVSNFDWDLSPDGTQIAFVSADDKSLWRLTLPPGARGPAGQSPAGSAGQSPAGSAGQSPAGSAGPAAELPAPARGGGKPYRLPFSTPPGPSTWYVAQWYGVTTGGYRGRNSTYVQGQGIHFGIDFATECGTPVVAVAPGTVIAVDGNFGSPPHNVVIQLADGNIAMYGHLVERTRHVEVGQAVQPGQVVGNTGDSIAPYNCTRNPHIHLEIRKGGRAVATNPVPYFDYNWDDLSLGVYPGPRFERNLDTPTRNQFLDDQPDIWFGGPIITNFTRPWPP